MYRVNFKEPMSVHFIGIGGISMSGLAEILLQEGFTVSGSDSKESELTRHLEELGATLYLGQRASNIKENLSLVVYTAAISPENPELAEALSKGIPTLTRAEFLGQLMENYKDSIAVAGTHGKTTTTSMITHILLAAAKDPTVSVGGMLPVINGNIRVGKSPVFLTEACEYTNSFLHFAPKYALILNVEEDHMDFFKDLADIRHSFREFAAKVPAEGCIFLNGAIPHPEELTRDLAGQVITYGLEEGNDYFATDVVFKEGGTATFTLMHRKDALGQLSLSVPGLHNVSNAVAAAALSMEMGLSFAAIEEGLLAFTGTDRRFQLKGKLGDITILDDYAHHPTEIAATLKTARSLKADRIVCVFQPHTYTRTKAFLKDFAQSLSLADVVVLADIYPAREEDIYGISSLDLLEELKKLGCTCYHFPSFDEIENFLLEEAIHNDLLITMGAGDIVQVGEHLLGC